MNVGEQFARRQPMALADLSAALREAVEGAPYGERVVSIHLFGIDHARELRGVPLKQLVRNARIPSSYGTEIAKGMKLAEFVRRR
jgi:5-methylcytosine-specific restriction protein B